ncbi:tetratricopeptide repeat protein [Pseudoponticoccus marisrubri]|uniref:Sel1 repeat protein n=1 Tax=Pseudoponticoccus marisrubri TaxID=1685382 RepID=A0A0W7WMS9_9RHOB|nr:SEL1-like repeat protein [Pseudoponticoccus marisrubri]KUF11831.1 hypothetical protein AVJ23_04415 [Pseudoponticoccus marisrubri]
MAAARLITAALVVALSATAAPGQEAGAAPGSVQALLGAAEQGPLEREERTALFEALEAMAETDPGAAFGLMTRFAATGDTKAQQELGTYYRQGIGTETDLQAAREWYQRAIEGGRPYALAPMARVEAALGNGAAALGLVNRAIDAGMPGAERQLGFAHVDRQLGVASDPARGREILMALIDDGDGRAARPLLLRYTWNRLPLPAPDRLVAQVEADGLAGDGPSAEAALVYLTKAERRAVSRRQALIEVPGIRDRILASERMWLAADIQPRRFYLAADEIIATTPSEHFPRAALTANRVTPNAYVRILQRELRGLGYYRGSLNGRLTRSTIAAHNRFCRDAGIIAQCREGPRKSATIRAVTEALAERRPGTK